jgi:hypothetical protein
MSTFNNYRYTPGNKSNLRKFINREYIKQSNANATGNAIDANAVYNNVTSDFLCLCLKDKANNIKQGWNDPSQTENTRISQILTGTLGGRTTFGNDNMPIFMNELGGWHGQPGGSFKPPRNKF